MVYKIRTNQESKATTPAVRSGAVRKRISRGGERSYRRLESRGGLPHRPTRPWPRARILGGGPESLGQNNILIMQNYQFLISNVILNLASCIALWLFQDSFNFAGDCFCSCNCSSVFYLKAYYLAMTCMLAILVSYITMV